MGDDVTDRWVCLSCNSTGSRDPDKHKCSRDPSPLQVAARGYWPYRLRWMLPHLTTEQVAGIVSKPIRRAQLAEWLGPSWA